MVSDPRWLGRLEDLSGDINGALASQDHAAGARARLALFHGIGSLGVPSDLAQVHVKTTSNELIRVYARHGWFQEALQVCDRLLEGQPIDAYCPNRRSVLHHVRARILMEVGDLPQARAELALAQALALDLLARVEQAWSRQAGAPQGSCPLPCGTCASARGSAPPP